MLDAQLALLENALSRYLNTGDIPGRIGSRHPLVTPFQAFVAADDALVVCCDTEAQWHSLCEATQRQDLVGDPRFADGNARTRHHAALEPLLIGVFLTKTRSTWIELLSAADVPCGPVNSIADIAADPQVEARQMIVQVGAGKFAAQPVRMASVDPRNERPAPKLGEHTAEILRELGYTDRDIEALTRT